MQDSPVGVRDTDYNSVFSSGQSVAATFDRGLMYARGYAMGSEHKGKGTTVQLGPVAGPIGRSPEGGRNWEGFSPDPCKPTMFPSDGTSLILFADLTGIGIAETIKGIQDAGVIACAKHFIGNEQVRSLNCEVIVEVPTNIHSGTFPTSTRSPGVWFQYQRVYLIKH
jgi:beta-glucosidase